MKCDPNRLVERLQAAHADPTPDDARTAIETLLMIMVQLHDYASRDEDDADRGADLFISIDHSFADLHTELVTRARASRRR